MRSITWSDGVWGNFEMITLSVQRAVLASGLMIMAAACTTTSLPPPPPEAPVMQAEANTPVCADRNFPIYFASNETDLDEIAQDAIAIAVEAAESCDLSAIEIVAQSDALGSDTVNMTVSQERADNVLDALMAADLDVDRIAIVAMGETNAVTEDNLINPMNRRVDVYFRE